MVKKNQIIMLFYDEDKNIPTQSGDTESQRLYICGTYEIVRLVLEVVS